jgi:ABC-type multidrug transport system fused ATPase/permease subunit
MAVQHYVQQATDLLAAEADDQEAEWGSLFSALDSRKNFASMRLFGKEEEFAQKWSAQIQQSATNQRKIRAINSCSSPVLTLLGTARSMLGFYIGGRMVLGKSSSFSAADLAIFVPQSQSVFAQLRSLFKTLYNSSENSGTKEAVKCARFCQMVPTIGIRHMQNQQGVGVGTSHSANVEARTMPLTDYVRPTETETEALRWSIEMKGVRFYYPTDPKKELHLNGIDLTVEAGTLVGLCGTTGCGKSTLFRLFQRIYDSIEGEITYAGRSIKDYEPMWLHEMISVCPSIKDTSVSGQVHQLP